MRKIERRTERRERKTKKDRNTNIYSEKKRERSIKGGRSNNSKRKNQK